MCISENILTPFYFTHFNYRHFLTHWLSTLQPSVIRQMNNIIKDVKFPTEFQRKLRSVSDISNWKAVEFLQFLFISIPLLRLLSPDFDSVLLEHWEDYTTSLVLLMSDNIGPDTLTQCRAQLNSFVSRVPELYGAEHLTSNVHTLFHLVDNVIDMGPLYQSSAFPFESSLGCLRKIIKGNRGVLEQGCRGFYCLYSHLWSSFTDDPVTNTVINQLFGPVLHQKAVSVCNGTTVFNKVATRQLLETEILMLPFNVIDNNCTYSFYSKLCYNKVRYTISNVTESISTCDSIVRLNDDNFVSIQSIVLINSNVYIFGQILNVSYAHDTFLFLFNTYGEHIVFKPSDIKHKGFLVGSDCVKYLVVLTPNCSFS